jgi:hypothetical protein
VAKKQAEETREPGLDGNGDPIGTDAVAARIKELEAKLAASEKRADDAEAEAARIADQPRPSDVKPGLVWDHESNKAVPLRADVRTLRRFQITATVKGYNESRAGVKFRESLGETDDPDLAAWFGTLGYGITDRQA